MFIKDGQTKGKRFVKDYLGKDQDYWIQCLKKYIKTSIFHIFFISLLFQTSFVKDTM